MEKMIMKSIYEAERLYNGVKWNIYTKISKTWILKKLLRQEWFVKYIEDKKSKKEYKTYMKNLDLKEAELVGKHVLDCGCHDDFFSWIKKERDNKKYLWIRFF